LSSSFYVHLTRRLKQLLTAWPIALSGPRHDITKVNSSDFLQPAIATVALGPSGCETCQSCPEGPAIFGESPEYTLPLLSPPPSHSSTVRAAQRPEPVGSRFPRLILRCEDCLRGRWCERCNRWWCEDCYKEPISRIQRTELQQLELREQLQNDGLTSFSHGAGLSGSGRGPPVKVYSKLCEHCLVSEMMAGAGSNSMWG
jgi:hypothetical protein